MRAVTRVLCCTLAVLVAGPAAARAAEIGLSDQHYASFLDPRFQALGIDHVRLVVPWDVALTDPDSAGVWLDAAAAHGLEPMVAFEASASDRCPDDPCSVPSVGDYRAAFAAFRARWPQVAQFTPWNEPNHPSQPTATEPGRAAALHDALRDACPACLVVAGDMLDSDAMRPWFRAYRDALRVRPMVWGLHNYGDTTHADRDATGWVLDNTTAPVWLTETGAIVHFAAHGTDVLGYDEDRAATAMRRALRIARSNPRIKRAYVYQWIANAGEPFDSGLLRPDGSARPSLAVLQAALARDPTPSPSPGLSPAAAPDPGSPEPDGATPGLGPDAGGVPSGIVSGRPASTQRGVRLRLRCVRARACRGRLILSRLTRRGHPRRILGSAPFRIAPGRSRTVVVTLATGMVRLLARRRGVLVGSVLLSRPNRLVERMWALPLPPDRPLRQSL